MIDAKDKQDNRRKYAVYITVGSFFAGLIIFTFGLYVYFLAHPPDRDVAAQWQNISILMISIGLLAVTVTIFVGAYLFRSGKEITDAPKIGRKRERPRSGRTK
jgi:uncharacterized membrane protein